METGQEMEIGRGAEARRGWSQTHMCWLKIRRVILAVEIPTEE